MDFVDELRMFPRQLRQVADAFAAFSLPRLIRRVVYAGMGGSGIAADFVVGALYETASVPMAVVKDYALPGWADERTLVVLTSYSGNTEETLAIYDRARQRDAMMACITSGGELAQRAERDGIPCYRVPAGLQPRMALGYSLGFQLLLTGMLIPQARHWTPQWLRTLAERFEPTDRYETQGREWAQRLRPESRFVIFSDRQCHPVGLRLMQQINENAKQEACVFAVPEFNHNGLEGWHPTPSVNYVTLHADRASRIGRRFTFMQDMARQTGAPWLELVVPPELETQLEVAFTLDFLSLEVARRRGVDARPVPTIGKLKAFLAQA